MKTFIKCITMLPLVGVFRAAQRGDPWDLRWEEPEIETVCWRAKAELTLERGTCNGRPADKFTLTKPNKQITRFILDGKICNDLPEWQSAQYILQISPERLLTVHTGGSTYGLSVLADCEMTWSPDKTKWTKLPVTELPLQQFGDFVKQVINKIAAQGKFNRGWHERLERERGPSKGGQSEHELGEGSERQRKTAFSPENSSETSEFVPYYDKPFIASLKEQTWAIEQAKPAQEEGTGEEDRTGEPFIASLEAQTEQPQKKGEQKGPSPFGGLFSVQPHRR